MNLYPRTLITTGRLYVTVDEVIFFRFTHLLIGFQLLQNSLCPEEAGRRILEVL